MVTFSSYQKPISPKGASLFLIYILYTALSITYAYNEEIGTKKPPSDNAIFATIIALSVPLTMWPLVNDENFAKEYIPEFFRPGIEDNTLMSFFKKFISGYFIAIAFPFLKLKSYIFGDKNSPDLAKYKYKEYFNYIVVPMIGFLILIAAITIAVYFNENVINATNSTGIYYMNPSQRTIYQIIFSLLLFTIFFSLIPYRMAEALDKTWNYYLMFFFSVVNLIIINNQLNRSDTYRQNVLLSVYVITIVMLLYSVYNLVFLSSESKDYRILTLGKLSDEDRININPELYGIYDAVRMIKDDEKNSYFDGVYFSADKVKGKINMDQSVIDSLSGNTKNSFNTMMKSIDQNFIDIYQARMSWEKSLKKYFKSKDENRNQVIDGFFESSEYAKLTNTPVETLSKAAKEFRQQWLESRKRNQLPEPTASQKVFGAAITAIGGNITMGITSALVLKDVAKEVDAGIAIIFNRYMFNKLTEAFSNVSQFMSNFKIYEVESSYERSSLTAKEFTSGQSGDITTLNNIKEFYNDFVQLLDELVTARVKIEGRNQQTTITRNLNVFEDAFKINKLDKEQVFTGIILMYYADLRYRISILIAIYNFDIHNTSGRTDDEKNNIISTYGNLVDNLYNISKFCLQIIYNILYDRPIGANVQTIMSDLNFNQDLLGGAVINSQGNNIIGRNLDLTNGNITSYKLIKPIKKNDPLDNSIENLIDKLERKELNFTLPSMIFDNKLLKPEVDIFSNNRNVSNAYENILIVYGQLVSTMYLKIKNENNGFESILNTIEAKNINNNEIIQLSRTINNIKETISSDGPAIDRRAQLIRRANGTPFLLIPNVGLVNNYNIFINNPNTENKDNFLRNYSEFDRLIGSFSSEYDKRRGISNIVPSFLSTSGPINQDVKFFQDMKTFPSGNLTLADMRENVFYEFNNTTNKDKLNINPDFSREITSMLKEMKYDKNSVFSKLSDQQKNTIAKTKRFQEIYKFYFPTSKVRNGQDVDNLYTRFREIYASYLISIRDYLLTSVETKRDIAMKTNLARKKEIEIIDQGFPDVIRDNNQDLRLLEKGQLGNIIADGQLEAAGYEEYYKDLMSTSKLTERVTLENVQRTKQLREATKKELANVTTEKRLIFANIVTNLMEGKDTTIRLGSKDILKISFPRKKAEIGNLESVTDTLIGKVYNIFTKLMLRIVEYSNNFNNFDDYTRRQGNIYSAVPFLSFLISNYYMLSYENNVRDIHRYTAGNIDSLAYEKLFDITRVDPNQRNNNNLAVNSVLSDSTNNGDEKASNPTDPTLGSALRFLDDIGNTAFSLHDYKAHSENINNGLKEIQKNLYSNLTEFIFEITSDNNITTNGSQKRKNIQGIMNNATRQNNIYYHMLLRASKEGINNNPNDIGVLTNAGNPLDYNGILGSLKVPLSKDDLINILETDFDGKINMEENKDYPQQTLIDTVINNPIINSLKVISSV